MSNGNNVFKALIAGMALGAGTALLLAPKTGEETREQIRELGNKASSLAEGGGTNIASRIRNLREEIQQLSREAVEGGSGRVQDELESLRKAFEEGRKVLKEERERRFSRDLDEEEEFDLGEE